jgi:ketosteroid isomerase-like protein
MDPGTHATNYLSSKKRNIAIDINDMAHTLNDKFIFMKINLLPLLLFLSSSVVAQEPDSSSALFKMREAEQNFAKASVMFGRNAAFVENFAEESILFTDKWITGGKQFSKDRKAAPFVLKWEPEYMDIADSRDFGISTGPWEVGEYRPGTPPLFTGYFLTVWKKQADGVWKVILDGGGTTPAIKDPKHKFLFPSGADKPAPNLPVINIELSCKELLDREKQILGEWERSPVPSTYTKFLSPNVRIQFSGHLPTTDADTINSLIAHFDKNLIWKSSGSGAATSGDMGFTYGLLEIPGKPEVIKGHYVRIWKRQPGADWKIVLEMMNF